MATSNTFQVTGTLNGTAFTVNLSAHDLITVITSGSGAKIQYEKSPGVMGQLIVTETAAAIATASDYLILLTDNATGASVYINPDRIKAIVTARTTEANVYYDALGAAPEILYVNQTRAAIQTAISAIVGSGGSGPVTTGITAFAGGGQASATQLSFGYNEVTVVATTGDSVKLQAAQADAQITVINEGANPMDVYPATGDTINDGAANAAISVAPGVTVVFVAIDATNWETTSQTIAVGNGTVALPSLTFTSDPDNGMYRIGANNYAFAANGAKVVDIATTGVGITGALDVSTNQTFAKEVNHTITVTASTTATVAGGNIAITSGTGNTSGAGGTSTLSGGVGGATGLGGNVTVSSGAGGGTSGASGNTLVTTAAETGTDASGNLALTTGTSASAASGILTIGTGNVATLGNSGAVATTTGNSTTSGDSGAITNATGTALTGNSGLISYTTGAATTGNSGNATLGTGTAATGNTGSLTLSTGSVSVAGAAGDIAITAGNSIGANEGGDITVTTGNASTGSGTGGDFTLATGTGAVNGTSGTDSGDITVTVGAAGTATTGTGGTGGDFLFTGAAGGAASGAAGIGGAGSTFTVTLGAGGATADAAGGAGGAGGGFTFTSGNGGAVTNAASASGAGGAISFTAGNSGAGSTAGSDGGAISFTGGNGTGTAGAPGNITLTPGTSATTTRAPLTILAKGVVNKKTDTSVATGATATAIGVVGGHLSVTGATGNVTLPTAAEITTAIGATPVGTTIEFVVNAVGMTAANVVTILPGANTTVQKMISAGDVATDQLMTVTNTSNVNMGIFRICYITATTCSLHRIG